ncbi:MAG: glycosyltransferase family 2 protein [Opitutales bacterium]|nr:glycosyltransferase family 2 protein [Opitutales bacterium]
MISDQRLRLGIVIPLANEELTIDELLRRVCAQIGPDDRVFCVLDNMCKDNTKLMIQGFLENVDNRVSLVWAPENRCVVDAYFRGYREAYDAGCAWILEMDGGLSHLPEEIPQFVMGMEEGYDYVGGSRYLKGGTHDSPLSRRIISRGGTALTRLLLRVRLTDMTSGFECFSRTAMELVLKNGVRSRANFFQTEIRYMMSHLHWKEVPIRYTNDKPTIGRSSLRESFRILFQLLKERS